jgi:hypothetical protein
VIFAQERQVPTAAQLAATWEDVKKKCTSPGRTCKCIWVEISPLISHLRDRCSRQFHSARQPYTLERLIVMLLGVLVVGRQAEALRPGR